MGEKGEKIAKSAEGTFKKDLTTPIPERQLNDLRVGYLDRVLQRQSQLERLTESEMKELQITGEYPILTKYDAIQGKPGLIPPEVAAEALMVRHVDLETFIHPQRLTALKETEKQGYVPIREKDIPVLNEPINKGETVSFPDFGFGIETVEEIAQERGLDPEEIEDSANEFFANGTFSWTTNRRATLPYIGSSTPDAVGGAQFLATMAIAQGQCFVPVDSIWGNPDNQLKMWEKAMQEVQNDPVLHGNPNREFIIGRAQDLIGVTLKANPRAAVETAVFLHKHGVNTFRVYDPRSLPRMIKSVDAVRQALGTDVTIYAGQTIGIEQAHVLQDAGANAVIVGIGEGGICQTPKEASLAVNNLLTGYQIIKSGLTIPLIYDAGVGPKSPVAIGIGAGGVMKSQAIGKGIEKPPFMYWYQLPDERWASLYSGEAAPRTKYLGGKLDKLGRPIYVEGADEMVIFDPNIPSTATYLYYLHQGLATALVFQRGSLADLQHDPYPDIHRPSQSAIRNGSVHHTA